MDYVLGGVAALVSGNVTPNRPKLKKRALTPTKHQASPNVTPKSEFVDDRSIFLSPSVQKKKAIVKKSPKRIFQNPDLDTTTESASNTSLPSPKADKVKKHLKEDLEADISSVLNQKSPSNKQNISCDMSPKKKSKLGINNAMVPQNTPNGTPNTPQKNKKIKNNSVLETVNGNTENIDKVIKENKCSPKKKKKRSLSMSESVLTKTEQELNEGTPSNKNKKKGHKVIEKSTEAQVSPKKKKKRSLSTTELTLLQKTNIQNQDASVKKNKKADNTNNNNIIKNSENSENTNKSSPKKKNRKRKKPKNKQAEVISNNKNLESEEEDSENETTEGTEMTDEVNSNAIAENINKSSPMKKNRKRKKPKNKQVEAIINNKNLESDEEDPENETTEDTEMTDEVNPNAITNEDTDSEHESDDDIDSEDEQTNKEAFNSEPAEESSDEETETNKQKPIAKPKTADNKKPTVNIEDEIKRTIFIGNVPFSNRCKKEIKKIFNIYGDIETVRIRTVPVKDPSVTPKMAVIKKELHPDRTTVNVYVKFTEEASVGKALAANNKLMNNHHLRVSRSNSSGSEHDPRLAIFVGNMPFTLEDDALRQKFGKCGEIESVRIVRDKKTNAGKGFGYVNFASKDGVELALTLTEEDLTIKNRILRVKRCTQSTQKQKDRKSFPRKRPLDRAGREVKEGAHRRIFHKRKNQDGSEEPPNKRPKNMNQPNKEKKQRKEFVGMTAGKKKKQKFNKGQKKKKALSEIMTK